MRPFHRSLALVPCIALAVGPLAAAAESLALPGKVTAVILYQGQALVTRTIPVESPAGSLEVVVGDLPENVVADSLFAEGDQTADVRAVRYRSRAVGEEPREEVRALDQAMQGVKQRLDLNQKKQEIATKKSAYLDKLEGFVAPTAEVELSKGVLDAVALEKITTFSFEQRAAIAAEQVELAKEARELQEEASLLERKRAELAAGSSRSVREAVVFLEKSAAGPAEVRLNYLVGGCGWSPSYVFRAASGAAEVPFEYNAIVRQMTGEDWSGVKLTLSTASPALSAAGPGLAPFYVSLTPAAGQQPAQQLEQQQDVASQVRQVKGRKQQAAIQNLIEVTNTGNVRSSWDLNAAANDYQNMELLCKADDLGVLRFEDEQGEGPSMSYELAGRVSLSSRSDQQMVRVLAGTMKGKAYHVATPVLSSYVYREAELTNGTPDDLLGGPVTAYLDGRFVGRTEIPTVARGQTFVVGFGADPQLRTRRELLTKTEAVQGGNREMSLAYALTVESYKDAPSTVRIHDRLPYSSQTGIIRVTLKDPSVPISEDKVYLRRERPKGMLRWDVEVPAGAIGEQAKAVEYAYTVEYERKFQLTSPTSTPEAAPALQMEFEELQKARVLNQ